MKNIIKKLTPEKILNRINEARIKEELALPIYSSHIKQTLFWSGLSKDKKEKIIASLRTLEADSERHVKLLKIVARNFLKNSK